MDRSAEIETLLQQSLNLDSDNESEWDELEYGSEMEDEEIEFPIPPVASSTINERSQLLQKKRTSVSKRAELLFPRVRKGFKIFESSRFFEKSSER